MALTSNRAKSKSRLTFLNRGTGRFDVSSFCGTFRLRQEAVARLTGYSSRAIADWASGKPLSQSSAQRVTEIERLCEALAKVVKAESIGRWLQTPNDAFDGSTPLQAIERGEVDRLWRMIYRLESGEPG
jgi:transcriptional regulator with XRE-family HTH domain